MNPFWIGIIIFFGIFSVGMYIITTHDSSQKTVEEIEMDDKEQTDWIDENTKTNLDLDEKD